ncbi:collagen alpha-1(XII) chain-like [Alosa pseudoharengus]|uniref:collagen alpha-1(XII) chain-like n=1 Tax=Alosa pseudoharengus TaxID=34774 RepID=UPI003F8B9E82
MMNPIAWCLFVVAMRCTAAQGTSCSSSATELTNRTSQAAADIVFLLDGSGSVAADQFLVMKTFVKNVTRSLLQFNTSFAFAQYSSGTSIHVTFHQFQRTGWENQVDSISQIGGGTNTAAAIQTVVNSLFDSSAGTRPDAHRILIVLTDGRSSDASNYPSVTALADGKNITRYAIGIGSAFSSQSAQDELRSIASSPESDYVFRVDNFEALDNISSRLEKSIMVLEGVIATTCSPITVPEPPVTASQGVTSATCLTVTTSELTYHTNQAAADIAFLLDGSGSVAAADFIVMKTFVKNVTASLLEFNTSFAFAQYSSGTSIHVTFHQFQRTGWENQVDSISQIRGGTNTANAIQTVVNSLFDSSAGARPDAHRILIVLTDGQSSDASNYPSVTALADGKNITRYAIGIGSAFSSQSAQDELRSIASSPESDYVFRVDNFEALDNISSRLEKSIMAIEGVTRVCLPTNTSKVPAVRVICMEKFMAFELERSAAIGLHEDHLRLNDPNCTLYSNGTHVLVNMSLTACGTFMEDDGEYLIFKNEVTSFDDPNDIITRRHEVEIEFCCKYPKKSGVTIEFDIHRPSHTFKQKGFGSFTYQFEFFQSAQFLQMMDPNTYPLDFILGDMMYWQIEAICSVPNTELFVESCIAAPSDNPNEPLSYNIIENGCKVDETVQMYSSHQSKVQLGMKVFKFLGLHDQVFITCSVILCKAGVPGSRCSQGCTNSSVSGHRISKREAPFQTAKHYISQGPLRLRRDVASPVSLQTQPTVNMNLVVVVGALLAAVAMVCGVLIYKTGGSKVKYERVPSPDI